MRRRSAESVVGDVARELLERPYEFWTAHLEDPSKDRFVEGFSRRGPEGSDMEIEVCVTWEDRTRGLVRVCVSAWCSPPRRLFGLLPIHLADGSSDFLLGPQPVTGEKD